MQIGSISTQGIGLLSTQAGGKASALGFVKGGAGMPGNNPELPGVKKAEMFSSNPLRYVSFAEKMAQRMSGSENFLRVA
ncbi:MAG TPA: hypothetical protein ENI92_03490 [Bacteroidetes bacterium]|nr:hypothetical protein [Bacteroidota bacterium]